MSGEKLVTLAWNDEAKDLVLDPATGGLKLVTGLAALEQAVLLALREHLASFKLINARPERLYQLMSQLEDDLQAQFTLLRLGGMRIAWDKAAKELSLTAEVEGEDGRAIELKLKV